MAAAIINNYDVVIVLLDHEPDDYLALLLLSKHLQSEKGEPHPKIVLVSGGGDAEKEDLTKKMAESAKLDVSLFIKGRLDYFFNPETQTWVKEKVFPEACFQAFGCEKVIPTSFSVHQDVQKASELLNTVISNAKRPCVIALKPIWEFYFCDTVNLSRCDLFMYGSFNIRQMYDCGEYTKDEVAYFLQKRFKSVFLYEAFFATGPDNSMSTLNQPQLFEKLALFPELVAHMRGWNDALLHHLSKKAHRAFSEIFSNIPEPFSLVAHHLKNVADMFAYLQTFSDSFKRPKKTEQEYAEMQALFVKNYDHAVLSSPPFLRAYDLYGLSTNNTPAKMEILMERTIKIIASILAASGQQMVIADFALMALLLDPTRSISYEAVPSTLFFNEKSLTEATPDPTSSVKVVKNVNRAQLFDFITSFF